MIKGFVIKIKIILHAHIENIICKFFSDKKAHVNIVNKNLIFRNFDIFYILSRVVSRDNCAACELFISVYKLC